MKKIKFFMLTLLLLLASSMLFGVTFSIKTKNEPISVNVKAGINEPMSMGVEFIDESQSASVPIQTFGGESLGDLWQVNINENEPLPQKPKYGKFNFDLRAGYYL